MRNIHRAPALESGAVQFGTGVQKKQQQWNRSVCERQSRLTINKQRTKPGTLDGPGKTERYLTIYSINDMQSPMSGNVLGLSCYSSGLRQDVKSARLKPP